MKKTIKSLYAKKDRIQFRTIQENRWQNSVLNYDHEKVVKMYQFSNFKDDSHKSKNITKENEKNSYYNSLHHKKTNIIQEVYSSLQQISREYNFYNQYVFTFVYAQYLPSVICISFYTKNTRNKRIQSFVNETFIFIKLRICEDYVEREHLSCFISTDCKSDLFFMISRKTSQNNNFFGTFSNYDCFPFLVHKNMILETFTLSTNRVSQDSTLLDQKDFIESETFSFENFKKSNISKEQTFRSIPTMISSSSNTVVSSFTKLTTKSHNDKGPDQYISNKNMSYRSEVEIFLDYKHSWFIMKHINLILPDSSKKFAKDANETLEWEICKDFKPLKRAMARNYVFREMKFSLLSGVKKSIFSLNETRKGNSYSTVPMIFSSFEDNHTGRMKVHFGNEIKENSLAEMNFNQMYFKNNQNVMLYNYTFKKEKNNPTFRNRYLSDKKDSHFTDFFNRLLSSQFNQMNSEDEFTEDKIYIKIKSDDLETDTIITSALTDQESFMKPEYFNRKTITVIKVCDYFNEASDSTTCSINIEKANSTFLDITDFPTEDYILSNNSILNGMSIEYRSKSLDSKETGNISKTDAFEFSEIDDENGTIVDEVKNKNKDIKKSKITPLKEVTSNSKFSVNKTWFSLLKKKFNYEKNVLPFDLTVRIYDETSKDHILINAFYAECDPLINKFYCKSFLGFRNFYSNITSEKFHNPFPKKPESIKNTVTSFSTSKTQTNQDSIIKKKVFRPLISNKPLYNKYLYNYVKTLIQNLTLQTYKNAAMTYKIEKAKEIIIKLQNISSKNILISMNEILCQIFRETHYDKKEKLLNQKLQNSIGIFSNCDKLTNNIINLMTLKVTVEQFFNENSALIFGKGNKDVLGPVNNNKSMNCNNVKISKFSMQKFSSIAKRKLYKMSDFDFSNRNFCECKKFKIKILLTNSHFFLNIGNIIYEKKTKRNKEFQKHFYRTKCVKKPKQMCLFNTVNNKILSKSTNAINNQVYDIFYQRFQEKNFNNDSNHVLCDKKSEEPLVDDLENRSILNSSFKSDSKKSYIIKSSKSSTKNNLDEEMSQSYLSFNYSFTKKLAQCCGMKRQKRCDASRDMPSVVFMTNESFSGGIQVDKDVE